ncbi:MAG: DUF3467 domain-containing protein [Bacteroidales bacterium]|nr:DUF3467 domain-containing protein [Bacteroidales bacterium]MBQ2599318.1 DUF3467 domain-containing protein [Bacteroidales bacterium]
MDNNNNNPGGKKIDIEIKPEVAQGRYANLAIITHSSSEFILDFAQNMPGLPKMQVTSRVIMTPEHAKRLLGALSENIRKYESQFGEIRLPMNPMMMPPIKSDFEA